MPKVKDEDIMSASQEKRRRQSARVEGTDKKQAAIQKEAEKKKKRRITTAIVGTVVALVVIALVVLNSNLFYTVVPAVKAGDESYTTAEFNYFYYTSYFSFMNSWGDYASWFIDTDTPLSDQYYDEETGATWQDYFKDSALANITQMTMLVDEANAAGFTLTDENREDMESSITYLNSIYAEYGYNSLNHYLSTNYGKGMNEKTFRRMMELSYLASAYASHMSESFEYTEDELDSYYLEHADEYDIIAYRSYYVSGAEETDDNGEIVVDAETAMAAAKDTADSIAAAADVDEFAQLVYDAAPEDSKEIYEDPDYTLTSSAGSSLNAALSEWLLDSSRKEGDTAAIESDTGYYALYFVNRNDNHYYLRQVRHVLIKAVADEDGAYTDEAKDAALERATELYEEWQNGDATEASFSELAGEYSEDTGSNTNGGLYDSVYEGQMVAEFDAFLFDPARQPGDTTIVYGEGSSYAGYHIMYYVGESDVLYSSQQAESALRSSDYTEWETAKLEAYTATTAMAYSFTAQ